MNSLSLAEKLREIDQTPMLDESFFEGKDLIVVSSNRDAPPLTKIEGELFNQLWDKLSNAKSPRELKKIHVEIDTVCALFPDSQILKELKQFAINAEKTQLVDFILDPNILKENFTNFLAEPLRLTKEVFSFFATRQNDAIKSYKYALIKQIRVYTSSNISLNRSIKTSYLF